METKQKGGKTKKKRENASIVADSFFLVIQ